MTKYNTEETFKTILGLEQLERDSVLKHVTIDNLINIMSDRNTYCKAMTEIENQIREWEAAKFGLEKMSNNLKTENSKGVYKYANIEVIPEIDGYTFARLVNLVSNVTKKSLSSCSNSVYTILWRLYFIKDHSINQTFYSIPDSEDILLDEAVLKTFNIPFDKKLFWILDDISKKWKEYSPIQKEVLAKSISSIRNMETFLAMMEKWRSVDDPVICGEVEEILHSCKYISASTPNDKNVTKTFETCTNKLESLMLDKHGEYRKFIDVLDDVAKWYTNVGEDERKYIVTLFSTFSDECKDK